MTLNNCFWILCGLSCDIPLTMIKVFIQNAQGLDTKLPWTFYKFTFYFLILFTKLK